MSNLLTNAQAKALINRIMEIIEDDDIDDHQRIAMIQAEIDDATFGGFDDDD
jgi:hypothetical protein